MVHQSYDALGAELEDAEVDQDDPAYDDDPQCVCGVYRSEHAMMGCSEGFQTAKAWESEKEFISSLNDDEFDRIYHPYE